MIGLNVFINLFNTYSSCSVSHRFVSCCRRTTTAFLVSSNVFTWLRDRSAVAFHSSVLIRDASSWDSAVRVRSECCLSSSLAVRFVASREASAWVRSRLSWTSSCCSLAFVSRTPRTCRAAPSSERKGKERERRLTNRGEYIHIYIYIYRIYIQYNNGEKKQSSA